MAGADGPGTAYAKPVGDEMDASSTDSGVVLPPDEQREAAIALAILRGSVESRCRQAPVAFLAMLLNAIASVLLIGRGIHLVAVSVWLSTTTILMLLRYSNLQYHPYYL